MIALFADSPVFQKQNLVHRGQALQTVCIHQQGALTEPVEEIVQHLSGGFRVESFGGFVRHQNRRILEDGPAYDNLPLSDQAVDCRIDSLKPRLVTPSVGVVFHCQASPGQLDCFIIDRVFEAQL
jgi:hypothetical protein